MFFSLDVKKITIKISFVRKLFLVLLLSFICLNNFFGSEILLSLVFIVVFRDYVQRAFEKCETEDDKDQTEQFLKNMLTSAFKDGTAWVVDWDKESLPR